MAEKMKENGVKRKCKKMGSGLEISFLVKMIFQDLTLGCDI
jgi:hypothetical protein